MNTIIDDPTGLAKRMHDINPKIVVSLSRTSNDEYCYIYRQTFSLSEMDFAIEAEIACRRIPGEFELTADLVTSNGESLLWFPKMSVDSLLPIEDMEARMDKWVRRLCKSLADRVNTIAARLEAGE